MYQIQACDSSVDTVPLPVPHGVSGHHLKCLICSPQASIRLRICLCAKRTCADLRVWSTSPQHLWYNRVIDIGSPDRFHMHCEYIDIHLITSTLRTTHLIMDENTSSMFLKRSCASKKQYEKEINKNVPSNTTIYGLSELIDVKTTKPHVLYLILLHHFT